MTGPADRRERLVRALRAEGVLHDPAWIAAFRAVSRQDWVPRFFLPHGQRWAAVARGDEEWLEHATSPEVLAVQLDDDPDAWARARRDGPIAGTPTSSSSMPAVMALMLEELRVRPGQRVLEIGTGTGYNTALLCHRLGAELVSTVDVDPALVESARAVLAELGYHPACSASDGAQGFPPNAPYDRVLCTCAVSRIPPAWLAQTVPGGLVVTTLTRPIGAGLVRIEAGPGATGQGRVLARNARFMPLRAHRDTGIAELLAGRASTPVHTRRTALPVAAVTDPAARFGFHAGLALPRVQPLLDPDDPEATLLVHPDGSWVRHGEDGGEGLVQQAGPRMLWDLAEAAHREWGALGEPARERYGLTIEGDRQEFWLDRPDSALRWPLDRPEGAGSAGQ